MLLYCKSYVDLYCLNSHLFNLLLGCFGLIILFLFICKNLIIYVGDQVGTGVKLHVCKCTGFPFCCTRTHMDTFCDAKNSQIELRREEI